MPHTIQERGTLLRNKHKFVFTTKQLCSTSLAAGQKMCVFISIYKIENILDLFIMTTIFNVSSETGHRFSIKMRPILANYSLKLRLQFLRPRRHCNIAFLAKLTPSLSLTILTSLVTSGAKRKKRFPMSVHYTGLQPLCRAFNVIGLHRVKRVADISTFLQSCLNYMSSSAKKPHGLI